MALSLVPQSNQTLGQTQAPILGNFTNIDNQYQIDHVEFNAVSNQGFHNKVTFPRQTSAPANPPANAIELYNILDAATGLSEIFSKRDDGTIVSLTAKNISNVSGAGWTYLPSGVLINIGTVVVPVNNPSGTATVNLGAGAFKPYNNILYKVYLTPGSMSLVRGIFSATNLGVTTFDITGYYVNGTAGNSISVNFMTVGVPS